MITTAIKYFIIDFCISNVFSVVKSNMCRPQISTAELEEMDYRYFKKKLIASMQIPAKYDRYRVIVRNL